MVVLTLRPQVNSVNPREPQIPHMRNGIAILTLLDYAWKLAITYLVPYMQLILNNW